MTRLELMHLVSRQAPRDGAWSADIYDGETELLMPPHYHRFTVANVEYWWFHSSHHIKGTQMSMSNQLVLRSSDGLFAKFSMGALGDERRAIGRALAAIRKRIPEWTFGAIYGDPVEPSYITDAGISVWMWRKGQRVRFLTAGGVQVGPEHPQRRAGHVCRLAAAGGLD